jgi:hypothetical protein
LLIDNERVMAIALLCFIRGYQVTCQMTDVGSIPLENCSRISTSACTYTVFTLHWNITAVNRVLWLRSTRECGSTGGWRCVDPRGRERAPGWQGGVSRAVGQCRAVPQAQTDSVPWCPCF